MSKSSFPLSMSAHPWRPLALLGLLCAGVTCAAQTVQGPLGAPLALPVPAPAPTMTDRTPSAPMTAPAEAVSEPQPQQPEPAAAAPPVAIPASTPAVQEAQTALAPVPAAAASAPAASQGRVEAGFGAAHLSGASGDWRDAYVRGMFRAAPGTTINAELASQGHFNERGTLGAVSVLQDLSPDWFVMGGVGAGTADFQYRVRADVGVFRKWGNERRWVSGVSLMRGLSGDDVHRDWLLTLTTAYHAPAGWVGEGGLLLNHSQPGSVNAVRGFGAATLGDEGKHLWSLRLEHGREAYLPAGVNAASGSNVSFTSSEVSTQLRQWLGKNYGLSASLQYYRNPYYKRMGGTVGMFFDF